MQNIGIKKIQIHSEVFTKSYKSSKKELLKFWSFVGIAVLDYSFEDDLKSMNSFL